MTMMKPETNTNNYYAKHYKIYYKDVFCHVLYLTGNVHFAEDITSDVFIKLMEKSPDEDNIRGWLLRVASNLTYNSFRNKRIHKKVEDRLPGLYSDNVISIEDEFIIGEDERKVHRILGKLKPDEKMCLLLKFSGYKYYEIAEIMNIKTSSIGQKIIRGQKKFKKLMMEGERI